MSANFLATAASGSVQNSGFEGGDGTWTSAGNCTLANSAAQAHTGADSMAMTSSAAGNMSAAHCTAAAIASRGMRVVPGRAVSCSAWFRSAVSARQCKAGLQFYTAAGAQIGTQTQGAAVTDSTTGWVQATVQTTAPATAAYARAFLQVLATGAASEVHFTDDVVLLALSGKIPHAHWWADLEAAR